MFEHLTQEATTAIVESSLLAKEKETDCVLVAQLVQILLEQTPDFTEEFSIDMIVFKELTESFYARRHCKPKMVGLTPPFSEACRNIILTTQRNAEFQNTLGSSANLLMNSASLLSKNTRLLEEPVYLFIVEAFTKAKVHTQ